MMTGDLPEKIPQPDTSGAANTQVAAQGEVLPPQPDSPMSMNTMGEFVHGLASDGGGRIGNQGAVMLSIEMKRLEADSAELREISPKYAVLEEQNKNLRRNKKLGAILNIISTLLFGIGIGILTNVIVSDDVVINTGQAITAGAFIFFGLLLSGVVIFTSLWGSD